MERVVFLDSYMNLESIQAQFITLLLINLFHALTDDELWFFLEGDEAEQTIIYEDGRIEKRVLNKENRESLVVKNAFQATRIKNSICGYSLFSTVMSPKYRDDMYISGKDDERMKSIKEVEDLL